MKENKQKKHPLSLFALRTKRATGFLIVAFLFFNYPLISIANQPKLFLGIPVLYLYLFILWIAVIVISSFIINKNSHDDVSEQPDSTE